MTDKSRIDQLVDAALDTELAGELVDMVARRSTRLEADEDLWASGTMRVRMYVEWAVTWTLTTLEMFEIDIDLRPEDFALVAASRLVGWPNVIDPDRDGPQ